MKLGHIARWTLWPLLAFTVFMALSPSPPHLPIDRMGDKFTHMTAFAVLTLITRLAYPAMPVMRVLERMALFGALIEVFQAIPELHRDCDWRDWVADMMATGAMLALYGLVARRWGADRQA